MEIATQSFKDLTEECLDRQSDYLALLVRGIEGHQALQIIGRSIPAWKLWRKDERFREIEEHIKANRERYIEEADGHFRGKIAAIEMGLINLAGKVVNWEALEPAEKGMVLRACSMVRILEGGVKKEASRGYEEKLLSEG